MRTIIQKIREHTPNRVRWTLGPYVAYIAYWFRMHVLGNKAAPKVLSVNDTLDLIIKNNLSVIRYGDGEMSIMQGTDLGFQKADPALARRLKEIIGQNPKGLLVCLPDLFGKLENLAWFALRFALHHQLRYRHEWLALLSSGQVYGNTFMTRPYLAYKASQRENSGEVFRKLFSIWRGQQVVLIEGSKSRVGVGNDMFKNTASVSRILGPAENAYAKLSEIFNEASKFSRDKLMLLALGPAAKVLGYDLFRAGYRVIDVGHLDMEYEMYLRNEAIQTKLKYKYLNEINERNPEECTDPEYLSKIIVNIQ